MYHEPPNLIGGSFREEGYGLIERQTGESLEAWRVRVMLMKVNKEIDLDWIEIRDMCEMDCSVDQLRKMAQGVRMACDAMDPGKGTSDGIHVPERYTRQASLVPQGDLFRPLARQTALYERIMASIKPLPAVEVPPLAADPKMEKRELVVAIADCHYGAEIHVIGLQGEVINAGWQHHYAACA